MAEMDIEGAEGLIPLFRGISTLPNSPTLHIASSALPMTLTAGSHATPEEGRCFMEMVACYAGEPHSDRPDCACPVLGGYGMVLNCPMGDEQRDALLLPLVPLMAESYDPAKETMRADFLALWVIKNIVSLAARQRHREDIAVLCEQATSCAGARTAALLGAGLDTIFAVAAAAATNEGDKPLCSFYPNKLAYRGGYAAEAVNRTAFMQYFYNDDPKAVWTVAVEGLKRAIQLQVPSNDAENPNLHTSEFRRLMAPKYEFAIEGRGT